MSREDKRVQANKRSNTNLATKQTDGSAKVYEDARCPSIKSSFSSNGMNAKGNID